MARLRNWWVKTRRVSMAFSEWKKPNFLAFFFLAIFFKNSVLSE